MPNDLPLRRKILHEFHASPSAGHSGEQRTYHRLAQIFWWAGLRGDVRQFVRECDVCQRNKADLRKPAGLLTPLPIPDTIWADISMDFVEGLPRSNGRDVIFVVVDRLSKYAHFMTLAPPFSAKDVAREFVKGVVKLHGIPASIVSDRDKVFLSLFWRELFRLQGTELKTSTAYHPETDGQTEVVNRGFEQYLRCFVSSHPKLWERFLAWAEYWYNTTFHQSPFEAVYGRKPPPLVQYLPGTAIVQDVDQELRSRDEVLRELKGNLEAARNRMKQVADRRRRDESFKVEDWVYLKLQPYRQHSIFKRVYQKLANRFYGPFRVAARVGTVAYKLELPDNARIHPIFQVSLLRRRLGEVSIPTPTLPPYSFEGEPLVVPEKVLASRSVERNGVVDDVLVHWHALPEEDATWEVAGEMARRFPEFSLEDKSIPEGVGNVTMRRSARAPKPNSRYFT